MARLETPSDHERLRPPSGQTLLPRHGPEGEGDAFSLHDFLHLLRKRFLIFFATFLLVILSGMVKLLMMTPVYQAGATLRIERPPMTAEWQLLYEESDIKNVLTILNSPALLQEVLELEGIGSATPDLRFTSSQMKDAPMIEIVAEDSSPNRLLQVFNRYLELATTRVGKIEGQKLEKKVQFIRTQLTLVENRIASLDVALRTCSKDEEVLSIPDKLAKLTADLESGRDDRRTQELELAALSETLGEMRKKATEIRSQATSDDTSLAELIELRTTLLQLERERIKLSATYQDAHPDVVNLDQQLAFVREQIKSRSQKLQDARNPLDGGGQFANFVMQRLFEVENQQQMLTTKIRTLDQLLKEKSADFKKLSERLEEYNSLVRQKSGNEQIHASLIEKLNQSEIDRGTLTISVKVLSAPVKPTTPIRPLFSTTLYTSCLLGLIAGVLLAFVQENFDNSLKTTDDAQAFLNLQCIGTIPDLKVLLHAKPTEQVPIAPSVITFHHRQTPESESFRALRATLSHFAKLRPFKTLMLTSWASGMGKTTVTMNLALTFAQMGSKVILIDADLRKPTLHHHFFLSNHRGLSDLLLGADPEKIIQATPQNNLFVIPSGPIPPNPPELLGSEEMKNLIRRLGSMADYVIFDAPPLLAISDSLILAPMMNTVLYLCPIGFGSRKLARKGLEMLRLVDSRPLGLVCNYVKRYDFEGYSYKY